MYYIFNVINARQEMRVNFMVQSDSNDGTCSDTRHGDIRC